MTVSRMEIVDKHSDPEAPLSDRIVQAISEAIIAGELTPGSRLREAELAARFGVSRAPLREALRLLEERRLIERLPYSGVRVIEMSAGMIADLYELREVLEGIACRRAAARITPQEIAELEALLAEEGQFAEAVEKGNVDRPAPIRDFHVRVAQISGNAELLRLLSTDLWRHARIYYRTMWKRLWKRSRVTHLEHVRILEALRERDGEMAEMLMRRHIRRSREMLEELISSGTFAAKGEPTTGEDR